MEVKNGTLHGQINGKSARLAYSPNDILELPKGSTFSIPIKAIQLKSYYRTQALPESAQFIASKTGKYYYSIFDKRAYNLAVHNRIYFDSSEAAEVMGYLKRE